MMVKLRQGDRDVWVNPDRVASVYRQGEQTRVWCGNLFHDIDEPLDTVIAKIVGAMR